MKKLYSIAITSVIILAIIFTPYLMTVTAKDWPMTEGELIKSESGNSKIREIVQESLEGWYQYEEIWGTLDPDEYNQFGGGQPYSVSVGIDYVDPSGYKVTVNIKVNGVSKWSGDLGAGQRSPTITANGGTTYVRVINNNDVQVYYEGLISWYFN